MLRNESFQLNFIFMYITRSRYVCLRVRYIFSPCSIQAVTWWYRLCRNMWVAAYARLVCYFADVNGSFLANKDYFLFDFISHTISGYVSLNFLYTLKSSLVWSILYNRLIHVFVRPRITELNIKVSYFQFLRRTSCSMLGSLNISIAINWFHVKTVA